MIRSVVFDVGETLLLGAVTANGHNNVVTFQYFRPGFDLVVERERREEAGVGEQIDEQDIYPDVRTGLKVLREAGLWVGIAGNQTARAADLLRKLTLPVDAIVTSGEWGVAKPDLAFFRNVIDLASGEPHEIVYVGDHRDHDIVPAHAIGLRTALIRRGPWGYLWADDPIVRENADWIISSLNELPALLLR